MNYEHVFRVLPRGEQGFSPNATLLPHLEQQAACNATNFSVSPSLVIFPNNPNFTAERLRIAVFLCPSDPVTRDEPGTSYLANWGVGFNDEEAIPNGPFAATPELSPFGLQKAIDGTSLTAAFSEACHGIHRSLDLKRYIAETPIRLTSASQFEQFAKACDTSDRLFD